MNKLGEGGFGNDKFIIYKKEKFLIIKILNYKIIKDLFTRQNKLLQKP